jgi:hypothetical protein
MIMDIKLRFVVSCWATDYAREKHGEASYQPQPVTEEKEDKGD